MHALEPAALMGVMSREATVFSRHWRTVTFAAVLDPALYLLVFGAGLGALISGVAGLDYIIFLGTGLAGASVLLATGIPGMHETYIKHRHYGTYDAMLAAPIDVHEIVTGELMWFALRAGVYGSAPLLATAAFGLQPRPTVVLVPFVCALAGFAFAAFGVAVAAMTSNSMESFRYVQSAVITPMTLLGGTFFPISTLPAAAEHLAHLNPLYHAVELIRHAALGMEPLADLGHLGVLLAFALVGWALATWRMAVRLID